MLTYRTIVTKIQDNNGAYFNRLLIIIIKRQSIQIYLERKNKKMTA